MKTLELIPGIGPTRKHIRVIGAAEEMLEALILARPLVEKSGDPDTPSILWTVDAAIAKATEPNYDRN